MKAMTTIIFSIITAMGTVLSAADPQPDERPNIVLIMADDFGYECVGAYGGTSCETPYLNRLAATGIRFDRAHSLPLCMPTRLQLLTGVYNSRNYYRFFQWPPTGADYTLGSLLRDAGYKTCAVGKWHSPAPRGRTYKDLGFDRSFISRTQAYYNADAPVKGIIEDDVLRHDFPVGSSYTPDLMDAYVRKYLDQHKADKDGKPFFLYYSFNLPHGPLYPPPDAPTYDIQAIREDLAKPHKERDRKGNVGGPGNFKYMVKYLDKMVGSLVAKLNESGLRDNTLILFTGDNGTQGVASICNGKRIVGGKGQTKDTGHHVPLIANWPRVIGQPSVCDDLIDFTDFFATFADLAGVKVRQGYALDGHSFAFRLRGQPGTPREWIYAWFQPYPDQRDEKRRQLHEWAQTKRYKLYGDGRFYDLHKGEKQTIHEEDLTPEQKHVCGRLQNVIAEHTRK